MTVYITDGDDALLEFAIEGADALVVPAWKTPARRDGLWNTTCCELFVRSPEADGYWEFNFSPSCEWAAYSFSGYRECMAEHPMDVEPHIEFSRAEDIFTVEADVDFGGLPTGTLQVAISAVIEETDGTKSYWALAHPPGKPDFHHPDCFALSLPAPDAI